MAEAAMTAPGVPRTAADELREWLAWAGKRLAGVPRPDIVDRIEAEAAASGLDVERPRVVCICGSTRFAAHMNIEAEMLTLAGAIVVRPEVIAYSRERDQQFVEPDVKVALDVLHLRKIDLADEVVVVTEDGYIGESTRREIAYAEQTGKPIRYAEYARLAQEEGA